ncbi:MAG: hypothetical protein ACR2IJ_07855 [Fluviibacter sp.]
MSKGVIVSPANRGVQVVVTDEQNVQLLVDGNRNVSLEVVPQPRLEVLVDRAVSGPTGPEGPVGPTGPTGPMYGSRVVAYPDATSITIDASTTDMATIDNTQAPGVFTINAPTGSIVNGQKIMLRLQSSFSQIFSWNAVFTGSVDLNLPTESSGGFKYDYMGFIYNSESETWQIIAKNFGF